MKVIFDPSCIVSPDLAAALSTLGVGPLTITVPRPNKYKPHQGKKERERRAKMLMSAMDNKRKDKQCEKSNLERGM